MDFNALIVAPSSEEFDNDLIEIIHTIKLRDVRTTPSSKQTENWKLGVRIEAMKSINSINHAPNW